MAEVLLPLTWWDPRQDLSKELQHQRPIRIRVPPSPIPLLGTSTVALPHTLPTLLLLLRGTPSPVVIIPSQLCPMLCILTSHTPRCLPVSRMGRCLPHRVLLRLPGHLRSHTLAQAQLLPTPRDLHLHLPSTSSSSRVIQDTVLYHGQVRAFHQPKTVSSETKWDPWLHRTATQQITKMSNHLSPAPWYPQFCQDPHQQECHLLQVTQLGLCHLLHHLQSKCRQKVLTALLPQAVLHPCPTVTMPWKEEATQICILLQQAALFLTVSRNLTPPSSPLPLLLSQPRQQSLLAMATQHCSLLIRMQHHHPPPQPIPAGQRILDILSSTQLCTSCPQVWEG